MIWRKDIHKVVLRLPDSWSNWNLEVLFFEKRVKPEFPREKPLRPRKRTNNKLNQHMASTSGFELGSHRWEVSTLSTVPSLLLNDMEAAASWSKKEYITQPTWS